MKAITVQNISKKFDVFSRPIDQLKELFSFTHRSYHHEFWALKDINFQVEEGETLGIIGPNGSGKTTLLRLLAGTTSPSEGDLRINGRISALLDLQAGFLSEFSGRENVFLKGALLGVSPEEMEEKFADIVAFSNLKDFIDRPIKTYSSGMIIRLGFSLAAFMDFDLLLIDEVLSVGDLVFQRKCINRMRKFKEMGKTIVIASHNLGDLGSFCQRLLLLREGKIEREGDTEELIHWYMEDCDRLGGRIDEAVNPFKLQRIYGKDTGEIKITKVEFLNSEGEPRDEFRTGEELIIAISYHAEEKIVNPLIRVQIFRNDGLWVHGSNTYRHGLDLGVLEGDGIIRLCFTRLNLLEGNFYLSVGIWPDEYSSYVTEVAYDLHEMAYILKVKSRREDGAGIFSNPGYWEVEK